MITLRRRVELMFENLNLRFQDGVSGRRNRNVWPQIATREPVDTLSEDYEFLTGLPAMRPWKGERVAHDLRGERYPLLNEPYEATVDISGRDVKHGRMGAPRRAVDGMAKIVGNLPEKLVFEVVSGSFTNIKCFDGKTFYATDHPYPDGTTFSNKIDKPLAVDTAANLEASYGVADRMLRDMKGYDGEPLDALPSVLVVSNTLRPKANVIATKDTLKNDDPNPYAGDVTVVSSPRIKTATEWHLLATDEALMPFILQILEEGSTSQLGMDSDHYFNTNTVRFGAYADMAAGVTLPIYAVGSTGTG